MADAPVLAEVGWDLDAADAIPLGDALVELLDGLPERPRLLGLGEPTHGVEEFPRLRNRIFAQLVERAGYRSIALESDCLAAALVDDFVAGGPGSLDEVMATGFSHGFGTSPANRELVAWMRDRNSTRDPADRIGFHGFDPPLEMAPAPSPRGPLVALHDYLTTHRGAGGTPMPVDRADVERLVGDDGRWTEPASLMDPARSVGSSPDVAQLRLLTEELAGLLAAEAPQLIVAGGRSARDRAALDARTAAGLLRYHAGMADPTEHRLPRLMAQRDAMMAANLVALADQEAHRGPTLVFANNRHLQREPSTWELAGTDLRWWSAGAITAALLGNRYAFVA
ncbi:MAG TPA: erythromycin esterase family protein, partial [Pseudonocardia sp.]|nr:erythromycin esterase family protein [Pseudonocardia sp.]